MFNGCTATFKDCADQLPLVSNASDSGRAVKITDSSQSQDDREKLKTSQMILASGAMHDGEPESKKAHLDDDKDDDKTSTYEDQHFAAIIVSDLDIWRKAAEAPVDVRSAQRTITTKSVSQSLSPNVLTALATTLPPTQAAPKTRLLRNCVVMNLSMEDCRDVMKPHQILTSFIRRKDSNIRGHRNHNGQENHHETHQRNQQEYSQEHNQEDLSQSSRLMRRSFKYPRDNRQRKLHVSPSDATCSNQKPHQLMAPTLLHQ
ncbi:hypothetical protein HPB50_026301 [Hyalomma asiaticum]|uniref:Uncharacterized protein n=1 Tax=Hyalomma asiaticum TaxID=266040 RepID=A0ACB7TRL9_HYAAI|nr:hypothetical protein HPB50_026301 [Hyalomma asiaticum]